MNKAQWRALYDFVEEMGYCGKHEVLRELKLKGSIAFHDTLEDLGEYDQSGTYEGMMNFLTEELI